ncbi:MAG: 2-oxoacid:acceptor oxidoreductase subunit alpha [Planctomycetota bacterium]|nr:2-oxoacid:acceptor oxidoreductase subunit alpha [Planctomycetota bacterium]
MPKQKNTVAFLMGNEACAVAAIHAGVRFFAGYPITPSSEIAAVMALKLPKVGGFFIQMEDEIASMAAIIGASISGKKTLTATSGPGFSLKQENLGYAALCEVPCVVVNVMRGGPSTGLPTELSQGDVMQARWGTHGDHPIIALAPSNVAEVYEFTIKAVNLAEMYRTPVVLLLDEVLAHTRERIEIPPLKNIQKNLVERKKPDVPPEEFKPYDSSYGDVPPMAPYGTGYRYHTTGLLHDEQGFPTSKSAEVNKLLERLMRKISSDDPKLTFTNEYETEDISTLLIAYGSGTRVAKRVVKTLRKTGTKIGLLQLLTLWPTPNRDIARCVRRAKRVFVIEHNMGQYIHEIERHVPHDTKLQLINRVDGKLLTPEQIIEEL